MKTFVMVIIASAILSQSSFADSRPILVYEKSTGDIVSVGYSMPSDIPPTQGVEYLDSDMPKDRLDFYKRSKKGEIKEKSNAEKTAITDKEKYATENGFKSKYEGLTTDSERIAFLAKTVAKLSKSLKEQDLN